MKKLKCTFYKKTSAAGKNWKLYHPPEKKIAEDNQMFGEDSNGMKNSNLLQEFNFKKKKNLRSTWSTKSPYKQITHQKLEKNSETREFLSKFSQAKSKFEEKSTPKIKKINFEVPKRKLKSTVNKQPVPNLTTPACTISQPNPVITCNIPLQQEPKKRKD